MLDPNLRTPWLGEKIFHSFLWHILNSFEAKLLGYIFYLNLITQLWHSFPVTPKFCLAPSTSAPKCIRGAQVFFFFFKVSVLFSLLSLEAILWMHGSRRYWSLFHCEFYYCLRFLSSNFCWSCFRDRDILVNRILEIYDIIVSSLDFGR